MARCSYACRPGRGSRRSGSDRLTTVRSDFFLDRSERLSERERALMSAMLHQLVGDVSDLLRGALPDGWAGANDDDSALLIDRLMATRLLDDARLVALLLRRAEWEGIAEAARSRPSRRNPLMIQRLVSNDDGGVAAAAMALILARGRRRDRFGQCLVTLDDLPAAAAERCVWCIAAALRSDLAATRGEAAADRALTASASGLIGAHQPERSLDSLTRELALCLQRAGQLEDQTLLSAAAEGDIEFLGHGLALGAGIDWESAAVELLSGDPARSMLLLHAAGANREFAAGLLAAAGDMLALDGDRRSIEIFESMTAADSDQARSWLWAPQSYRLAVERLDRG